MLSWLWSKAKNILLVIAVAAGPVLYFFGAKGARTKEKLEQAKKTAKRQEQQAAFYREMEKFDAQNDTPRSRGDLARRLRDKGL